MPTVPRRFPLRDANRTPHAYSRNLNGRNSRRHNNDRRARDADNWVGSSLLDAMDKMEYHVEEMLNLGRKPAQAATSPVAKSGVDTAALKKNIVHEISTLFEAKLATIIDNAVAARLTLLEASRKSDQTIINTLQATHGFDRQVLSDLDAFHRYEHSLNSALVERLFQAASLQGDPDARFEETTFDLQGTDSANSVLVSYVEMLVVKVGRLEEQVNRLQEALMEAEVQVQLNRESRV